MGFLKRLLSISQKKTVSDDFYKKINNNQNKITLASNLIKNNTGFYFDESIEHFFSVDNLLFFSERKPILRHAIKVRASLLNGKRVIYSSKISDFSFLNNLNRLDSIIFDSKVNEQIIERAIRKVGSIFVALDNDEGKEILKIFEKHSKKFYVIDLGSSFKGKVRKFQKMAVSCLGLSKSPSLEYYYGFFIDKQLEKYLCQDKCLVFLKKFNVAEEILRWRLDYLLKKKFRILLISNKDDDELLWKSKKIEKYDFQKFTEKYLSTSHFISNYDATVVYGIGEKDLTTLTTIVSSFKNNIFVCLSNDLDEVISIFKSNYSNFIYLNFGSQLQAKIKTFEATHSILSVESVKEKKFRFDSAVNRNVSENDYLTSKKEFEKHFGIEGRNILSNITDELIILCQDEEICLSLAKERISFLINNLGYSKEKILFFDAKKNKKNLDATCFWEVLKQERKYRLDKFYQIDNEKERSWIFESVRFEKKYESFIFFPFSNFGPFLNELHDRLWNKSSNIIWFFNAKEFRYHLYDNVQKTHYKALFYYAKLEKDKIVIKPKEFKTETIPSLREFFLEVAKESKNDFLLVNEERNLNKLEQSKYQISAGAKNISFSSNYIEDQEKKDIIFESGFGQLSSEDDPLFDETKEFMKDEDEDDDEDIKGGLD